MEEELVGAYEVQRVLEWLPRAPVFFDAKFVYSLKERLDTGYGLTERQLLAVRNIITKFVDAPKTKARPKSVAHNSGSGSGKDYYKVKDPLAHYY